MPISLTPLFDEQDAALRADPSWLGSEAHRKLLQDAVHRVPGLDDVKLVWTPSGQPGFWESTTRIIAAEQPRAVAGLTNESVARLTLLGLLHETLHALFSTPARDWPKRRAVTQPRLRPALERLHNILEDGRITALGKSTEPGLAEALDEFNDAVVQQARTKAGENAEGTMPPDPVQQLFFAVEAYALTSEAPSPLTPSVENALVELCETVDPTRSGDTDACSAAASVVLERILEFQRAGH